MRLIDSSRLVAQFAGLERRTFPTGKDRVDHGRSGRDDLCNACAGALVLAAVFTPWTYMLFAVVIGLAIGLTWAGDWPQPRAIVYVVAVLGTLVAVTVNLSAVWLPHEIVTFPAHTLPAGRTQEVGYVLSEDNGWITMLSTGPGQEHAIIRVPDAAVKTQTICERRPAPGHPWSPIIDAYTLWRVVTGANSYLSASVNTTCPYEGP